MVTQAQWHARWQARWPVALALASSVASSGCVDRLIRDFDRVASGSGGEADSEGLGETDMLSGGREPGPTEPGTECGEPEDCADGQTCFEGVCVGVGEVRISLSWSVVTDLDLHLLVPNGERMSFENPLTEYGELDVDDCVGGMCVNQSGTHVENIFLNGSAPRGLYEIRVVNFDGRAATGYTIEVAGAISGTFVGDVPRQEYFETEAHLIEW